MFYANGSFGLLQGNYLFSEIGKRVANYQKNNPSMDIIRMGIGDVTRPLCPAVISAMEKAVKEMGDESTFKGYGPEQGYDFLREAIANGDYKARGVNIEGDEIFISDGAKCDVGNIQELFGKNTRIAVMDPVYPAYVDTNIMAGRGGKYSESLKGYDNITYLACREESGFMPELPKEDVDVIYLCFPNNPTGITVTKSYLKLFVDYAIEKGALLLYDSAYEAYICNKEAPHSIYEIEGAKACAIEFRSMSKTAGFTGLRCAYTCVPHELKYKDDFNKDVSLNALWNRRHVTRFNGVSYVTQRAAEAVYKKDGQEQIKNIIAYYMENAGIIRSSLKNAGYSVYGGEDAPYVWIKTPNGDSWGFFDELLETKQIVGTPGAGFGKAGEGFLRMTAFATRENTKRAMERICGK